MSIEQTKIDAKDENHKNLCLYSMQVHRLRPTAELLKLYDVDISKIAQENNAKDAELRNISDGVYDFIFYVSHNENYDKILALIAEDANQEQELIARAFGYYAQTVTRGADELGLRSSVLDNGTYLSPDQILNSTMAMRLKQMLSNGYGGANTGVIKRSTIRKTVEEITDLEFGVDY